MLIGSNRRVEMGGQVDLIYGHGVNNVPRCLVPQPQLPEIRTIPP